MQLELPLLIDDAIAAPDAADLPAGATLRQITLDGRSLRYPFRRARRRTIGLLIDEHGLSAAAPQLGAASPRSRRSSAKRSAGSCNASRSAPASRPGVPVARGRRAALSRPRPRPRVRAPSAAPRVEAGLLHLPAAAAAPSRMRDDHAGVDEGGGAACSTVTAPMRWPRAAASPSGRCACRARARSGAAAPPAAASASTGG